MVLDRQGGPNWFKNWCVAPVIVVLFNMEEAPKSISLTLGEATADLVISVQALQTIVVRE